MPRTTIRHGTSPAVELVATRSIPAYYQHDLSGRNTRADAPMSHRAARRISETHMMALYDKDQRCFELPTGQSHASSDCRKEVSSASQPEYLSLFTPSKFEAQRNLVVEPFQTHDRFSFVHHGACTSRTYQHKLIHTEPPKPSPLFTPARNMSLSSRLVNSVVCLPLPFKPLNVISLKHAIT